MFTTIVMFVNYRLGGNI